MHFNIFQVLVGSHRLGRIDHKTVGDQVGADLERVAQAHKFCELMYVEMDPGDCLFFHCNILHWSDQNASDERRWAFLVITLCTNITIQSIHH